MSGSKKSLVTNITIGVATVVICMAIIWPVAITLAGLFEL